MQHTGTNLQEFFPAANTHAKLAVDTHFRCMYLEHSFLHLVFSNTL